MAAWSAFGRNSPDDRKSELVIPLPAWSRRGETVGREARMARAEQARRRLVTAVLVVLLLLVVGATEATTHEATPTERGWRVALFNDLSRALDWLQRTLGRSEALDPEDEPDVADTEAPEEGVEVAPAESTSEMSPMIDPDG
jgi:hypothetical protein